MPDSISSCGVPNAPWQMTILSPTPARGVGSAESRESRYDRALRPCPVLAAGMHFLGRERPFRLLGLHSRLGIPGHRATTSPDLLQAGACCAQRQQLWPCSPLSLYVDSHDQDSTGHTSPAADAPCAALRNALAEASAPLRRASSAEVHLVRDRPYSIFCVGNHSSPPQDE